MYLANFAIHGEAIVQGMVRLPTLPKLPPSLSLRWRQSYAQLVKGIHVVDTTGAGLRVVFTPGASLQRVLFTSAPETREMELRRFLAPFTRLETLVAGSAPLPLSREEYDAVADDVPPVRCCVALSNFGVRGAWLACDFRVAPLLDCLMAEAEAYGYRLGYQVNVNPVTVDRDVVRQARKNALAVSDIPGVPVALVEQQQRVANQLTRARMMLEEYLAVDAGPAVDWLHQALQYHFQQQFGAFRFESPSWKFTEWAYEDELACAASTAADEMPVDKLCASVIDDAEVTRLLGWHPSDDLADRFAAPYVPDGLEILDTTVLPENLPLPYDGNDPYLFVSYKRADLGRITATLLHLQASGYNLWYDRGIPGGAEWNAMLEERLTSCSAVLLFVSQAAVDSKYVRREVQFADTLNKPIISVQLETARLRHGMGVLLAHYQMLTYSAQDFLAQLSRAMTRII